MKLKPIIASYSEGLKIRQYLDESVLDAIAVIAQSPRPCAEFASELVAELVEMHVLVEQDGWVKLNTAVFLKRDIENVLKTVEPFANELAERITECGCVFQNDPAEMTIFLGGIIGLVQGMGMSLSQKDANVWEWKNYSGKYARSKVDFDEVCDVYDAIGPDYLNKTVLQGKRYTAVFIGPQEGNFGSLLNASSSERSRNYITHLNRYLVDAYAMLITGEIQNDSLLAAAGAANMYKQESLRTAVITNEHIQKYEDAIQAIIEVASSYYDGKQLVFDELLRSTTSGQQGVAPASMYMNLWRYIRKVTAKALYAHGFFRDSIPEDGCLTVFYENNVELIRRLLF